VAGAPVDALLARTDELARRWAMALILALPLERIGEIPLESFAREAPALCAHLIRALASDDELGRIARPARAGGAPSPAQRLAEMTGARDGRAAVAAMEALRGVLWEALLDELRWDNFDQSASARTVADLADRLACVCSNALVSSLTESLPSGEPAEPARAFQPRPVREIVRGAIGAATGAPAAAHAPAAVSASAPAPGRAQRSALGNGVVIVDEAPPLIRRPRVRAHPPPATPADRSAPDSSPAGRGARRGRARALPWDTPLKRGSERPDERA
jgi:hypothetical protein